MARIAFDMDGVIVDTYAGQRDWLSKTYPEFIAHADGKKFKKFLPEKIHQEFWEMLEEGSVFEHLPAMEGSIEALRTLNEHHEILIVTAATLLPNSCPYKMRWIDIHLPFLDQGNVVFCSNKSLVLADYLIDDHYHNIEGFTGCGILFTSKYSKGVHHPHRVSNWNEVLNFNFEHSAYA